jgi:hypothetical protein
MTLSVACFDRRLERRALRPGVERHSFLDLL